MGKRERVIQVIDGDTFLTDKRKYPVRLFDVYAPEKGDPGSDVTTKKLMELILGKDVCVEPVARDSYGRSVANVKIGNKSINEQMRKTSNKYMRQKVSH